MTDSGIETHHLCLPNRSDAHKYNTVIKKGLRGCEKEMGQLII